MLLCNERTINTNLIAFIHSLKYFLSIHHVQGTIQGTDEKTISKNPCPQLTRTQKQTRKIYVKYIALYAEKQSKKGTETKERTEFKIGHSRKVSIRRHHLNQDL